MIPDQQIDTQPEQASLNVQLEQARFNMQREQARFNMIEQQIRTWEVLDATVLDLLKQVPREDFVPAQYSGLAFADLEIPIGQGETMLSPKMEARIVQALDIRKTDKVLEIGTGSGYLTALLASLAKHVQSIEVSPSLSAAAAEKLSAHNIHNVSLTVGDAANGWPGETYDVIVFTGSVLVAPLLAEKQLAEDGRMFVVIGEAPVMQATMVHRLENDHFKRYVLFETCVPALRNAAQPERFHF